MSHNDEQTNVCCICLEEEDIKNCLFVDKIKHIPCNCNVYAHKICFSKTDQINCLVCHNQYLVSWNDYQMESSNKCQFFRDFIFLCLLKCNKIYYYRCNRQRANRNCLSNALYFFFESLFYFLIGIIGIWIFLIIGGYFFNAIVCLFNPYLKYNGSCFLNPLNPLFYLFGLFGTICLVLICCCCTYVFIIKHNNYQIEPII